MVTMSDVAREAGVSKMTVSNVLNGRRRVEAPTRDRVLAAVEQLGYEVNLTARHLKSGRTDTVALIVPSLHEYYSDLADQIAPLVEEGGRHLVLERTGASPQSEIESLSVARLRMYDGVLLSVAGLDRERLERVRTKAPIVLLGEREVPDRFDHVQLANEEGARLATAHMLAAGSRRILVLGGDEGPATSMATSRQAGWRTAHREAGLRYDPELVVPQTTYTKHEARETLRSLLTSGLQVDGVFAVTDAVALGAMSALTEHGLRIPDDVQVAGFDDLDLGTYVTPGLTTVDPNHEGVAQTAVRLLERRMRGAEDPPEHIVTPVHLVLRGSTRG
jgi:DNA-binding LacI/PurR family transcriptional regulator